MMTMMTYVNSVSFLINAGSAINARLTIKLQNRKDYACGVKRSIQYRRRAAGAARTVRFRGAVSVTRRIAVSDDSDVTESDRLFLPRPDLDHSKCVVTDSEQTRHCKHR